MNIHEIDRRVEAGERVVLPSVCFKAFFEEVERHIPQTRRWRFEATCENFTICRADLPPADPATETLA